MTRQRSYADDITEERVHGSLYTDPEVFADELTRIWRREWLFVGHASELAAPGDYLTRRVGGQPVILTRGQDGEIRVLMNRCGHRGNLLCAVPRGNTRTFRCPYHGWTYDDTGELSGVPFPQEYGKDFDRRSVMLARPPRVGEYRGFVFASWSAQGPSLHEHLGRARDAFDRLCDLSPTGRIELTAGWLRHRVPANWKMAVENQVDGYHPRFVHESLFRVAGYQVDDLCSPYGHSLGRDLGGGHTELDFRPAYRSAGTPFQWFGRASEDTFPEYVRALRASRGADADRLLTDGPPHVMVFPNLFLAEMTIVVIEPVHVASTVLHQTAVLFEGAAEINQRVLRQTEGAMGPAGLLIPDDNEMMRRNQAGLAAGSPEWLTLARGLGTDFADDEGAIAGNVTGEATLRGIWRHYRSLMS